MQDDIRWNGEATTDGATTLPEADRRITVDAMATILISTTGTTALCACTILVSTFMTDIALLGQFYRLSILVSKLQDARITLAIIFGHSTQKHRRDLHRNA